MKLEEGDLPPVLDVEHKPADMSIEDFQTEILTWLHIVEDKYHVKPIIYTYYKFKENYLSDSRFDSYPYWIAHYYVDKMEYKGEWKFWQHTDAGKLPGIDGYVDLNIYNGSYYDLHYQTFIEVINETIAKGEYGDETIVQVKVVPSSSDSNVYEMDSESIAALYNATMDLSSIQEEAASLAEAE